MGRKQWVSVKDDSGVRAVSDNVSVYRAVSKESEWHFTVVMTR
jgi:hypothetical protein